MRILYKYEMLPAKNYGLFAECVEKAVRLLAPLAPKAAQKMWKDLGNKTKLIYESYPICDETALKKSSVEIAVQINSKLKTRMEVPADAGQAELERLLLADKNVVALLEGKAVKKIVVVPGRLVNIII